MQPTQTGITQTGSITASLQAAAHALGRTQPREAERHLQRVLQHDPDHAEGNRLMGLLWMMDGNKPAAIDRLERALRAAPDDALVNMTLGSALMQAGETDRGLAVLQRSCELAPRDPTGWFNLGTAQRQARRFSASRQALAHAVSLAPDNIEMRRGLATVLTDLGELEEAADTLREILRDQPENARAWHDLANLKSVPMTGQDVVRLQALVSDSRTPDLSRVALRFVLAGALEDQREYGAAFDMFAQANATARRYVHWNRRAEGERVDAIAGTFSGRLPEPVDPRKGAGVILIVHVPRSGSTLLEQMLASHPAVEGAGETRILPDILDAESARRGASFPTWGTSATAEDWDRLGDMYLQRLDQHRSDASFVTDKTPWNWAFVGAVLAMLPAARVINVRRNALETCFSCYRQLFSSGCLFTYDLDDLVAYYAGYERLQDLWRRQFSASYLDCRYEQLQQDPEAELRRLLDGCGLSFDAACLDFQRNKRAVQTMSAGQVRQKLNRHTSRLPRYGIKLDVLREKLRAAGLDDRREPA